MRRLLRLNNLGSFPRVIDQIKAKNPRFFIAMADACNNTLDFSAKGSVSRGINLVPIADNYQHLFLGYQGYIIASSSKPGQLSWNQANGGLYTQQFLRHLNEALDSSSSPAWSTIMEGAESLLVLKKKGKVFKQQPQSEINIEKYEPGNLSIQILPKNSFRVGETMRIKVHNQGKQNGFVFLWDIDAHGQVSPIFPNQYTATPYQLAAGETLTIPDKKTSAKFKLTMGIPKGDNIVVALFVVKENLAQKVSSISLKTISATNIDRALKQLRQKLTNKLEQNVLSITTVDYEIY